MKAVVDRIVQYANRYQLTNVETGEVLGTFDFDEVTGTVQQSGTEIDAELFESIKNDFLSIMQGTQAVGRVGATQLTNQNIDAFVGADYWGKTFYAAGGNSVTGKPTGVTSGFSLEVLRGAGSVTIHKLIAASDYSGNSPHPNIYIREYVYNSWTSWEQIVTADGSYPTLGAGYLAKNVQIAASASQSSVGWWKVGSIDLSAIGRTAVSTSTVILVTGLYSHTTETGLLEVNGRLQDGVLNPTASPVYLTFGNLEPNDFCVVFEGTVITLYTYIVGVYVRSSFTIIQDATEISSNTNYFTFSPSYYGSTAPDGAVYAVLRNNASELNGKAVSDIFESDGVTVKEATNAQKLGNKAASEYALADDIPDVSNFAEKDGTYSDMTVGNAEKLNGKAASEYALTSDIPDVSNFAEKDGTYNNMIVGKATDSDKLGGKSSSSYALKTDIKDVGYSLYIKNNLDFNLFVMQCNNGTLPKNITSVLLDGSEDTFSHSVQGIKLPATLKQIQGINNAEIYIGDFQYDDFNNKAALWYEQKVVTHDYYIRDLKVSCVPKPDSDSMVCAFYRCGNIYNCTAYAYPQSEGGHIGFNECENIIGCKSVSYVNCKYCSNCRSYSGGDEDGLWRGTNYKVSIDTCDTNSDGTVPGIN